MRSEGGENVYWGKEAGGIRKDKADIKKLQEEHDRLNISPEEITPKMPENQPPRPTMWPMDRSGNILKRKQKEWDDMYGESHNEDGSPKIPEKSESGTEGSITKSISSGNKDVSAISKGVDTGIRIAGSAFMGPDVPLTPMQMGAVDAKVSMGNQISSDIQSAYDLGKISVTSSNTKIDKNLAANETLKTSALDKNAGGNSTNVVASGNKTTTSVTTTNNSVNRLAPPIAIRNPDLTATRARIGLGMGMAF